MRIRNILLLLFLCFINISVICNLHAEPKALDPEFALIDTNIIFTLDTKRKFTIDQTEYKVIEFEDPALILDKSVPIEPIRRLRLKDMGNIQMQNLWIFVKDAMGNRKTLSLKINEYVSDLENGEYEVLLDLVKGIKYYPHSPIFIKTNKGHFLLIGLSEMKQILVDDPINNKNEKWKLYFKFMPLIKDINAAVDGLILEHALKPSQVKIIDNNILKLEKVNGAPQSLYFQGKPINIIDSNTICYTKLALPNLKMGDKLEFQNIDKVINTVQSNDITDWDHKIDLAKKNLQNKDEKNSNSISKSSQIDNDFSQDDKSSKNASTLSDLEYIIYLNKKKSYDQKKTHLHDNSFVRNDKILTAELPLDDKTNLRRTIGSLNNPISSVSAINRLRFNSPSKLIGKYLFIPTGSRNENEFGKFQLNRIEDAEFINVAFELSKDSERMIGYNAGIGVYIKDHLNLNQLVGFTGPINVGFQSGIAVLKTPIYWLSQNMNAEMDKKILAQLLMRF